MILEVGAMSLVAQLVAIDLVFSLDSIITAGAFGSTSRRQSECPVQGIFMWHVFS
jgi:predicted tellurium resistance membrane protein TerC